MTFSLYSQCLFSATYMKDYSHTLVDIQYLIAVLHALYTLILFPSMLDICVCRLTSDQVCITLIVGGKLCILNII